MGPTFTLEYLQNIIKCALQDNNIYFYKYHDHVIFNKNIEDRWYIAITLLSSLNNLCG